VIESMATLTDTQLVSFYWIMKNIFGFSDAEIKYESMVETIPLATAAEIALQKAIQDHDEGVRPS